MKRDTHAAPGCHAEPLNSKIISLRVTKYIKKSYLKNLSPFDDFFTQFLKIKCQNFFINNKNTTYHTRERNHSTNDSVGDEGLVVAQLVAGESGDGVQEEGSSLGEITNSDAVKSLINPKTIATIPITTLLDQLYIMLRCVRLRWYKLKIYL